MDGAEERVEHDELVGAVLDPGGGEAEVGLAIGLESEIVAFDELRARVGQHPAEGQARGAVGTHRERCGKEVAVGFGVALDVRVALAERDGERRHEACALGDARRKLVGGQLREGLPGNGLLGRVVLALRDPRQHAASGVGGRPVADGSGPAGVVPGHAGGKVLHGKAARSCDHEQSLRSSLRGRVMTGGG